MKIKLILLFLLVFTFHARSQSSIFHIRPQSTPCEGDRAIEIIASYHISETIVFYEWFYNGVSRGQCEVNGAISQTFYSVKEGDEIYCIITSDTGERYTSNVYVASFMASQDNSVSLRSENAFQEINSIYTVCYGQDVNFLASASPSDYHHIYQWYINDRLIKADKSIFTANYEDLINEDKPVKIYVIIYSTGGCISGKSKKSREVWLNYASPSMPPAPTMKKSCDKVELSTRLPAGESAFWQTSESGTGFEHNARGVFSVTSPGTYYLRSYNNNCWGDVRTIEIPASSFLPSLTVNGIIRNCNSVSLSLGNTGIDSLYIVSQDGIEQPFSTINRAGVYRIRNAVTGCISDPVTINASDIPSGISCNRNYIREQIIQTEGITDISRISAGDVATGYTYYDGLGRLEQTLSVALSPYGNDVVIPVAYDSLGRQARNYLPYEAAGKIGGYITDALRDQSEWYRTARTGIPEDRYPFSETRFEASPLNRILKEHGAGQAYIITCRVWGMMKYFHPNITAGRVDWDDVLLNSLDQITNSKDPVSFNRELWRLIKQAGSYKNEKSGMNISTSINLDICWMNHSFLNDTIIGYLSDIVTMPVEQPSYYLNPDFTYPMSFHEKDYDIQLIESDYRYRILSLFRYWNAVYYFFAYKYTMKNSWDQVLSGFIPRFLNIRTIQDYHRELALLASLLDEGHSNYSFGIWPGKKANIILENVDGAIYVREKGNTFFGLETGLPVLTGWTYAV